MVSRWGPSKVGALLVSLTNLKGLFGLRAALTTTSLPLPFSKGVHKSVTCWFSYSKLCADCGSPEGTWTSAVASNGALLNVATLSILGKCIYICRFPNHHEDGGPGVVVRRPENITIIEAARGYRSCRSLFLGPACATLTSELGCTCQHCAEYDPRGPRKPREIPSSRKCRRSLVSLPLKNLITQSKGPWQYGGSGQ